jgi:hypothetical protein
MRAEALPGSDALPLSPSRYISIHSASGARRNRLSMMGPHPAIPIPAPVGRGRPPTLLSGRPLARPAAGSNASQSALPLSGRRDRVGASIRSGMGN